MSMPLLAVGPHVCVAAAAAVKEVGAEVHLACFDLSPEVINLIQSGDVAFTIDQQQRLQGYMPIIVLHLYNQNAGAAPGCEHPLRTGLRRRVERGRGRGPGGGEPLIELST